MGLEELTPDISAEQLLTLALRSGADAAEVFQSRSLARPVFFEANRLKQLEYTQSEGTALRLWMNGSPGLVVAYGAVDPTILVERAIALSQLNPPEIIELTPANQDGSPASYPAVGTTVDVEELVLWGNAAIDLVRQAYPDVLCTAEWECETEITYLINSYGLTCSHTDTTLSSYLNVDWVRGDDFLNVSDGQIQRDSLNPSALAEQIIQRLDWARKNISPPIGRYPVLFTSKAADMLWGTVQSALNGKQVLEGASPWSDRLGEQVTATALTISQQPNSGPFSCPFDDEGTPTRQLVFIQDGVLQLFYTDRTVGRQLGSGTTGNGFRPSLSSYPTPGLFNFVVQPSSKVKSTSPMTLTDLISTLDDGVVVDQMLGGSAGISGDFSVNVDLGYRVRGGQIIGRVKDTMVSGNVYTALRNLVALGTDADWNGSCYTPSLIVDGLSVTGRES
ncbi:MAG: TldD/PmbA family protein [Cyanobacteria bacterium]|nr:TldD/PmbA family protein [Cyanobacteriota bacterium]MDW8200678.1 TldD/PmbA family protein [Cyanobacteriota bacterium SKYGB_h_bin112]